MLFSGGEGVGLRDETCVIVGETARESQILVYTEYGVASINDR